MCLDLPCLSYKQSYSLKKKCFAYFFYYSSTYYSMEIMAAVYTGNRAAARTRLKFFLKFSQYFD